MARDASLRQRGSRQYSFADHGNSTQGSSQGKFIIRNNLAQHWKPCWGDGVTVIRPFPAKNLDDPNQASWDPYRFSAEHNDFGDWIRRYDAVRNFGDPGVTFLMSDPADNHAVDPQTLPPWVLYNAIDRAVANGQDQQGWAALLRGGRGRSATLPRPTEVYLIQGAIMQHKNEIYSTPKGFGNDDKPVVMELSSNAGTQLLAELAKMREDIDPSQVAEGDWESMFLNGDPVAINTGRFITFYKLADGDPRTRHQQAATGWQTASQNQMGGNQQEPIGYGCFLEPTFNGIPANLQAFEQVVWSKVKPWDEILHFPTVEEQAALIADKFPPDVVLYAFRDHPDWIPETIRNAAVARHQVAAPNTQGGWGAPGQMPQGGGQQQPQAAGMPPAGPAFPQQQQFPQQGQAPQQNQAPQGFGAPQDQAPQGQQPGFGTPPSSFPTSAPEQPAQPPQGFGAPQGQAPQTDGPTGGPPPQQPPQGFGAPPAATQPPQGFGAPPAAAPPQGFGAPPPAQQPGPAPQDQAAMAWAGQGNAVAPQGQPPAAAAPQGGMMPPGAPTEQPMAAPPTQVQQPAASPMGQTPGGFAPQSQPPQQQAPQQQAPPQQAPPQQPPQGQPQSRAAAALAAAQAAVQQPPQG